MWLSRCAYVFNDPLMNFNGEHFLDFFDHVYLTIHVTDNEIFG